MDSDQYEMTDSEEEYVKEDKMLLDYARKSMKKKEDSSDEEVYGFGESDSNEEEFDDDNEEDDDIDEKEENSDIDMGSDIEDEDKPPDDRAWGKKKKSFYSTDFVDQDYEGVYQGAEAEIAELEEVEAKNIQKRLVEQLHEADFSIMEEVGLAEAAESVGKEEVIEADLSKLSKRQKVDLLKKESPEFFMLVEDFKEKIQEANKYLPLIDHLKSQVKKSFPALDYLQTKLSIILNYCTNMGFYLYLKARRIPIKNHPVLKSLFRYRQLLEQMREVDDKVLQPQVDSLLVLLKSGKHIPLDEEVICPKKTLKVLAKKRQESRKKKLDKRVEAAEEPEDQPHDLQLVEETELDTEMIANDDEGVSLNPNEKRAITYEMAKNKGLTPRRKKELRNPRVKNRKKYEKAKIRRKGQVRIPRKEIPVYGGEATGIKIGLTKSIKIK